MVAAPFRVRQAQAKACGYLGLTVCYLAIEPFSGPISDCSGTEIYAAGEVATIGEMLGIQWAADNVKGAWSGGPGYDECK